MPMIFRLIDWLNMALGPGSWSGKSKSPTHRDSKARHAIVSRSEWRAEVPCRHRPQKSNAPHVMSAFHPIANEQRTQFYVGFVPLSDIRPAGSSATGWPYLSRSGNAIYYHLGVTRAQREPGQHEFHQREHRITSIIRHQRP